MVIYCLEGSILIVTGSGAYRTQEWDAVFATVARDSAVPEKAPLLLDIRDLQVEISALRLTERTENLRVKLGVKLGAACAVVASPRSEFVARQFRITAETVGLRVGSFAHPDEAMQWLAVHATSSA
jgi:hypothetical protein